VKDEADKIHQNLCGEKTGRTALIVIGRNLHEIDADDCAALRDAL